MTATSWRTRSTRSPSSAARSPIEPGDYAELFRRRDRRPHRAAGPEAERARAHLRPARSAPAVGRPRGARRAGRGRLAAGDAQRSLAQPRPMRHELGLDLPERRIGLSAHDFAQALGAPEVILTRAAKLGGAPTVASRFVQRLAAVAGETRWNAALARGARYLGLGARARRDRRTAKPAQRPAPDARRSQRGRRSSASPRSSTGCAIPTRSTPSTFSSCGRSTPSTRRPARATAAP